ncbi:hypothetical protein KQX54_019810 [Cotesia glomerata]|uniref:Uncharacterized protein n=1 Tax=Cotesia glomerata TaxID=32391 RepID=A0AAV7J364_COTGL|nr:hypothetical protein KQX54_019810 [Cotesia glomerata]
MIASVISSDKTNIYPPKTPSCIIGTVPEPTASNTRNIPAENVRNKEIKKSDTSECNSDWARASIGKLKALVFVIVSFLDDSRLKRLRVGSLFFSGLCSEDQTPDNNKGCYTYGECMLEIQVFSCS